MFLLRLLAIEPQPADSNWKMKMDSRSRTMGTDARSAVDCQSVSDRDGHVLCYQVIHCLTTWAKPDFTIMGLCKCRCTGIILAAKAINRMETVPIDRTGACFNYEWNGNSTLDEVIMGGNGKPRKRRWHWLVRIWLGLTYEIMNARLGCHSNWIISGKMITI